MAIFIESEFLIITGSFQNFERGDSSYPCLAIPNFLIPFTVECDALKFGVGEVLAQKGQSIAFEGRKLTSAEQNFSVYDKEMLAIMHALEKFK